MIARAGVLQYPFDSRIVEGQVRGWIVKLALTAWIDQEEERNRLTREALADVDAGQVIDHQALDAYLATLAKIAEEDIRTADLVRQRVERALDLIQSPPGLGTPVLRRGERRFRVADTGHVVNYRVLRHAIRIQLWYRARRQARD